MLKVNEQAYGNLITQFVYSQFPFAVPAGDRFEVISNTVFGSKQRRFGPMPSPEVQTSIRDVLRRSGDDLHFFSPWGSRKQADDQGLDVLELMALKQLRCLKEELGVMGVQATFHFRLEDLTDRWLFGDGTFNQSMTYIDNFMRLARQVLGGAHIALESMSTAWPAFQSLAAEYAPVFYKVLRGEAEIGELHRLGWAGNLPPRQRDYYASAYKSYWPNGEKDIEWEMAKYFAATLARIRLNATGAPTQDHLLIAFTHPVPDNPVSKNRLYYRTIPQRFTNNHRSPWIGRGYLQIGDDNSVTPKSAGMNDVLDFQPYTITVGDAKVEAPYVLL
jgi:hypothetical protein